MHSKCTTLPSLPTKTNFKPHFWSKILSERKPPACSDIQERKFNNYLSIGWFKLDTCEALGCRTVSCGVTLANSCRINLQIFNPKLLSISTEKVGYNEKIIGCLAFLRLYICIDKTSTKKHVTNLAASTKFSPTRQTQWCDKASQTEPTIAQDYTLQVHWTWRNNTDEQNLLRRTISKVARYCYKQIILLKGCWSIDANLISETS